MAETQMRSMTPEEFYQWQLDQDERYELVEGVPVPLRAMTGASMFMTRSWSIASANWGHICGRGRAGWPAPTRRSAPRLERRAAPMFPSTARLRGPTPMKLTGRRS